MVYICTIEVLNQGI